MYLKSRKAYHSLKQGPYESLAQYSERFHDTYLTYMNTSGDLEEIKEKEQAMDFFHGLDEGRYGTFKTNMLTVGLQVNLIL